METASVQASEVKSVAKKNMANKKSIAALIKAREKAAKQLEALTAKIEKREKAEAAEKEAKVKAKFVEKNKNTLASLVVGLHASDFSDFAKFMSDVKAILDSVTDSKEVKAEEINAESKTDVIPN